MAKLISQFGWIRDRLSHHSEYPDPLAAQVRAFEFLRRMACLATQMSIAPRQCSIVAGMNYKRAAAIRCSASRTNGHLPQFFQLDDGPLQVFRDESKGIVCYKNPTGEITCEGFDEGPHFQPSMDKHDRIYLSQLLFEAKAAEEPLVNGAGI